MTQQIETDRMAQRPSQTSRDNDLRELTDADLTQVVGGGGDPSGDVEDSGKATPILF